MKKVIGLLLLVLGLGTACATGSWPVDEANCERGFVPMAIAEDGRMVYSAVVACGVPNATNK